MSRFAAGLHKLKEVAGKPMPTAEVLDEVKAATAAPPAGVAPSRRGKVAVAAYFDPAVRKQLAILAVKEDRSQAALLAEALNLLFERYGESPIARA
jgi:hypothetical protein